MRRSVICLALLLVAAGAWPIGSVSAHTTATGLVALRIDGSDVDYQLTLTLDQIDPTTAETIHRASNGDQTSAQAVAALLRDHVDLRLGGQPCEPGRARIQGSDLGVARAVLDMAFSCPDGSGDLVLTETWPQVLGSHYASIVDIREAGASRQLVLNADQSSAVVSHVAAAAGPSGWFGFVNLGIWHILEGIDHLLFVAALMIGSATVLEMLGVVTAFTVAHSITLALATLNLVHVPAAIVEPLIAASIVAMAGEVLLGLGVQLRWLITFAFGLVHGFGFATVLQDLSLSGWPLAHALVGFNVGVEIGQAAVILLFVPILFLARRSLRQRWVTHAPAAVIALCGAFWTVERLLS